MGGLKFERDLPINRACTKPKPGSTSPKPGTTLHAPSSTGGLYVGSATTHWTYTVSDPFKAARLRRMIGHLKRAQRARTPAQVFENLEEARHNCLGVAPPAVIAKLTHARTLWVSTPVDRTTVTRTKAVIAEVLPELLEELWAR